MENIQVSIMTVVSLFPYFLLGLFLFFVGKYVFDVTTPRIKDDEELTEKDNPAFGVMFSGYMLGVAIAITGAFYSMSDDIVANIVNIVTSGVAAIVLLRIGMGIGDKLILYKFKIEKEVIEDRNTGTGFAVAGLFVATGLVIAGVMSGDSDSYLLMLRDILIYWAVGQGFLILGSFVFNLIAGYDVHATIEKDDNTAAGLSLGGFFVGLGLIVKAALSGASSDLGPELLFTAVFGLVGLLLLVFARFFADIVLLPRAPLAKEVAAQKNVAAGAVSAVAFIGIAALYGAVVMSQFHQ